MCRSSCSLLRARCTMNYYTMRVQNVLVAAGKIAWTPPNAHIKRSVRKAPRNSTFAPEKSVVKIERSRGLSSRGEKCVLAVRGESAVPLIREMFSRYTE